MDGGNAIIDWYYGLPLITRSYLTGIAGIALLCQLDYVGPLQLYFNYRLVLQRNQWWRLVTPFLYFGPINFDFLFHMFFLMRYCRVLEEESFRNRPADFLVMLVFGGAVMLVVGPMLKATFLSTALTFMIVYVWARRNPQVLMNFLGVFNFTAPFMPWVLLGFSLLLSGRLPVADLIGIGAGHAYFYLADVFPLLYGWTPIRTPQVLKDLLDPPADAGVGGPMPDADVDGDGPMPNAEQNGNRLMPDADQRLRRPPSGRPPPYEAVPRRDDAAGVSPLNAPATTDNDDYYSGTDDDGDDSAHEAHPHKD